MVINSEDMIERKTGISGQEVVTLIDNQQKADNYRILKDRLRKALINGFWFEACMIEYAIIEDRTSSILQHFGICKNAYDSNKLLSNKLRSIKHQIEKGHPVISKKVGIDLITEIIDWKEERNEVVHRSCNHTYDDATVKNIAEKGNDLTRRLINDSRKISDYYKK